MINLKYSAIHIVAYTSCGIASFYHLLTGILIKLMAGIWCSDPISDRFLIMAAALPKGGSVKVPGKWNSWAPCDTDPNQRVTDVVEGCRSTVCVFP